MPLVQGKTTATQLIYKMKKLGIFLFVLFVFLYITGNAQELEFIFDTENAIECQRVQQDENGDFVLIGNMYDTSGHYSAYILKLNNDFDTICRIKGDVEKDILFMDFIVLEGNEYYILGTTGKDEGSYGQVDNIMVINFDENLDVVFEKQYALDDNGEYHAPDIKVIQNDDNKVYLTSKFLVQNSSDYNLMMQLNFNGDTIRTRGYYSNYYTGLGEVNFIMNNNGNIEGVYGFTMSFSSFSPLQILEIDTNFNISYTEIQPTGYTLALHPRFTTKWLDDSTYLFLNSDTPENGYGVDIFVAKFKTSHEIVGEPIWVGRPDTSDYVPRYGMDWTDPDKIFVCAYQFVYHVPWEVNQLVALIDSDLNIKGMKYYGEDLNYGIWTLCATDDGGAILPVGVHDYNNPYIDIDLVIWKISAEDLITSAAETKNPYDRDYLVFPNPGNDVINVQTARRGVIIEIFNSQGVMLMKKQLSDSYRNEINTSLLPPGNYIYKFTDNEGYTENGKWIKTY